MVAVTVGDASLGIATSHPWHSVGLNRRCRTVNGVDATAFTAHVCPPCV